jgi:hypothetical protein
MRRCHRVRAVLLRLRRCSLTCRWTLRCWHHWLLRSLHTLLRCRQLRCRWLEGLCSRCPQTCRSLPAAMLSAGEPVWLCLRYPQMCRSLHCPQLGRRLQCRRLESFCLRCSPTCRWTLRCWCHRLLRSLLRRLCPLARRSLRCKQLQRISALCGSRGCAQLGRNRISVDNGRWE